jgi:ribosomal protein L4
MKIKEDKLKVVEAGSLNLPTHKTANLAQLLTKYIPEDRSSSRKLLVVDTAPFDKNIALASRMLSDRINLFSMEEGKKELVCYDLLNCHVVILTDRAVTHLLEKFK